MAAMLRACAQLRLSACPCHISILQVNSHLNQFLVWRGIQPSHQLHKNSVISSTREFHTNCCVSNGEHPSSISTAAANAPPSKALETDEYYMQLALDQAQLAYKAGEVPVGAVIVSPSGDVLAAAHNATERDGDPTAHAEMLCIRHATGKTKAWRLLDATMYVTLEPCPMCAGAVLQARVGRVVYGARNKLLGADGSWISMMRAGQTRGDIEMSTVGLGLDKREKEEKGGVNLLENMENRKNIEDGREEKNAAPLLSEVRLTGIQPQKPHPFHPDLQIHTGVLEEQCSSLMKDFFKERRRQNAVASSNSDGESNL